MNTIEVLEDERITILNFLKELNPIGEKKYNEEILEITKTSSIRRGLQQLHDSRIYVDVDSIDKKIDTEIKDKFDRYLEFDDVNYIDVATLNLNKQTLPIKESSIFYFNIQFFYLCNTSNCSRILII